MIKWINKLLLRMTGAEDRIARLERELNLKSTEGNDMTEIENKPKIRRIHACREHPLRNEHDETIYSAIIDRAENWRKWIADNCSEEVEKTFARMIGYEISDARNELGKIEKRRSAQAAGEQQNLPPAIQADRDFEARLWSDYTSALDIVSGDPGYIRMLIGRGGRDDLRTAGGYMRQHINAPRKAYEKARDQIDLAWKRARMAELEREGMLLDPAA